MAEQDHTTKEVEWRVIPGFEAYEVSEYGEVRRCLPDKYGRRMRQLKPSFHKFGYPLYTLSREGHTKRLAAHQLVAITFLGPQPFDGAEVTHTKERNPLNNHYTNLKWATHYDNMQDAIRHGTLRHGDNAVNTKVSDEMAQQLCRDYESGDKTVIELSGIYGLHFSTTARIIRGVRKVTSENPATNAGMRHGDRHHSTKLSESDVRSIRKKYALGAKTQHALAHEYDVCQSGISKIIHGKRFAHVKD